MSRHDLAPDISDDEAPRDRKINPPLIFPNQQPKPERADLFSTSRPPLEAPLLELVHDAEEGTTKKKKKKSKQARQDDKATSPLRSVIEIPRSKLEEPASPEATINPSPSSQELNEVASSLPEEQPTPAAEAKGDYQGELSIERDAISTANEKFEQALNRARQEAERMSQVPNIEPALSEASDKSSASEVLKGQPPVAPPPPPRPPEFTGEDDLPPPIVPEATRLGSQAPQEKRIEVRHGAGILPALIVDFLSRRRDRKLRRTHEKDVKQLQKDISEAEYRMKQSRSRELSPQPKTSANHAGELVGRTASNNMEKSTGDALPPIVALEKEMAAQRKELAEKQKQTELRQAQELQYAIEEREIQEARRREKLQTETEKRPNIQPDLQIDHETTPEKTFDRRHEVLDRQSHQPKFDAQSLATQSSKSAPVPISQVLSQREFQPTDAFTENSQSTVENKLLAASADSEIYKKSLRTGFFVGLTIIIIGAIAYFTL